MLRNFNLHFRYIFFIFLAISVSISCSSTRKKGEAGKISKLWHNMNAKYNGFFNATEIMKKSEKLLEESHEDNYNEVLPVFPIIAHQNPKVASQDLDAAIEKATTVATLHQPSHWVDDCYVLMGKAQYFKQDFETAEETLEYFQEEFDPGNPYGRVYNKKKNTRRSAKEKKNERTEERKEKQKVKEEAAELKEEERENKKKLRDELKKLDEKEREVIKKAREREKKRKEEARKKEDERRKKEKEARKKARKNGRKKRTKKKEEPKVEVATKIDPDKPSYMDTRAEKELASIESKRAALELKYGDKKEEDLKEAQLISESKKDTFNTREIAAVDQETDAKKEGKKREVKKTIYPDGNGGILKHQPSYYEGVLLLSKTYIERDKYTYAEYLMDKLENEYPSGDDVLKALPAARAHMKIKQKEYPEAIEYLNVAIEKEGNKRIKARYAYIIAQLFEKQGDIDGALNAFTRVDSYNPSYLMEFNAKLKKITTSMAAKKITRESAESQIGKLLKENKYLDFRDQIYFSLGEIKLLDGDKSGAIKDFRTSLAFNSRNKNQQKEGYYKLATLFYDFENYIESKNYYDSTLVVLDKSDDRYFNVSERANGLTEIVEKIKIVNLQDSLIRISQMTSEEQAALAAKLSKEQKENNKVEEVVANKTFRNPKKSGIRGNSKFFAYNPIVKNTGMLLFRDKWGERKLADNWRRSDVTDNLEIDTPDEEENPEENTSDSQLTDIEIRNILKGVPNTPPQRQKVNNTLRTALFELGTLYRDRIKNYEQSAKTLARLNKEFPSTENEPESFYYQYLDYTDLNNPVKAQEYKSKLENKFPNDKFSKVINDPNYLSSIQSEQEKRNKKYADIYDLFNQGQHEQVKSQIEAIKAASKGNKEADPLAAKYDLLGAMNTGKLSGKDAYLTALRNVTSRHPNTPEETRAKEIMRFLKGDQDAFDSAIYKEELENFSKDDEKLHYVIAVLYDSNDAKKRKAKVAVSKYNKEHHKQDKLRISDIVLNREDKSMIILIRKFKNAKVALDYYKGVFKKKDAFIDEDEVSYDLYTVSQKNYREIVKQRTTRNYKAFFEENYL